MLYRFAALAARPAARSLFNRAFRPVNRVTVTKSIFFRSTTTQFLQTSSFHHTSINFFASSHDWNNQKPPAHPLIEKIQQHPHIIEQLVNFTSLLQSKGIDVSGKQPSYMQIMKVMSDPEIKEKVQKLAQDMQGAGIQLDMNTIQELQANFADLAAEQAAPEQVFDEKKPVEEEEQRGRKKGIMNKVKGIFKK
ncbi:hypothetical protein EDC94DRAFT_603764 [Helicostylum pulchrum]|nr:hypothetical protein EDC94DRAFT_603764 [Helicostylum pulchrum]